MRMVCFASAACVSAVVGCTPFDFNNFDTCCFEGEFETASEDTDERRLSVHVDPASSFIQRFRVGLSVNQSFLDSSNFTVSVVDSVDVVYVGAANNADDLNRFTFSDAAPGSSFTISGDADFNGVVDDVFVGVAPSFSSSGPTDVELVLSFTGLLFTGETLDVQITELEPLPLVEL